MKNKKGLSDVVTVVLIILLALAAVGIIWAFIRPALDTAGGNIDLSTECLKTEVVPIACNNGTTGGSGNVTVQVSKGDPSKFSKILAIVENTDGSTSLGERTENFPNLLGSVQIHIKNNEVDSGDTARAAVVLKNEEGQTYTCDPSPAVVTCS